MVLQDFSGATVMPATSESQKSQRKGMPFGAVAAASLATVALIFVASSSILGHSAPVDLMEEKLSSQHLMSQFSREGVEMKAKDDIFNTEGDAKPATFHAWTGDDSSTFDQLKDVSSRPVDEAENGIHETIAKDNAHHNSWYGKWGARSGRTESKWQTQLQALKAKAAARRKEEDESYFSGIYKAFGKKAGEQMMAAFEGKKVKGLNKIKIDEKALAARKQAIAHNSVLPDSKASKELHKAHRIKHAAAKQAVIAKQAKHAATTAAAATTQGKKPEAVKEALKVAKQMEAHTAPAKAVVAPKVEAAKPAPKPVVKKAVVLKHPGVIADARKIKQLVHEFRHAHGKQKKVLKARVMQLREEIVDDFSKVTAFGKRAKTALARAEAKGKKPQAARRRSHDDSDSDNSDSDNSDSSDSDSSSGHFVWH